MYEITLNPEDYGISALTEGLDAAPHTFDETDRKKWAEEVGRFADKLEDLRSKSKALQRIFEGPDPITATPASLKTLKIQLFRINDALTDATDLAERLGDQIVRR